MAQYDAIRALGESVLEMMRLACPLAALQLEPQTAFSFASLNALINATPPQEGFYLCVWRVGIGGMPRMLPPRRARDGKLYKPSVALDLYFLLLPIAKSADKQAQMLGWVLGFMNTLAPLTGETINRYAKGDVTVFAAEESVELIADPLPTADYLALWDRIKSGFQAGMTYVARMVLIDSDQTETEGALVTERVLDMRRPGDA